MFPLIQENDICRFISCDIERLKKGDVALFHTLDGRMVAHRYYYSEQAGTYKIYFFKGDTNLGWDKPIGKEQFIGKLASIQKPSIKIGSDSRAFMLWGRLLIVFPIVTRVLRLVLSIKRILS